LVEFIIGSFIYAKYRKKYKLKYIFKSWEIYPSILFALFYIYLEITIWQQNYYFLPYAQYIKTATLLSYIPLIIKWKLYEDENGFILTSPMVLATLCLGLGSKLNKITMNVNENYMPSFPSNTYWTGYIKSNFIDGIHIIGNSHSHLIPLCNTIDIYYSILSWGDILVRLYVFIIIYNAIKISNKIIK